nr:sulfatase-like hydrolase/transferase [Clostridia bacterium]
MQKVKAWIKENSLVLLYFLFAVLIEMTAVFVVEGSPFLSRPFLSLGLLIFLCGIVLLIKSNLVRLIVCAVLLIGQGVLDIVFAVIYNMTDQYFDLGMLNLRNDAFGILENIPLDFVTFYAGLFFSVMFIVYGMRVAYKRMRVKAHKKSPLFYVGVMLAGIATLSCSFVTYYPRTTTDKYDEMVDGKAASAYSAYGMIGNLLGELGNAVFQDRTPIDGGIIDEFIYKNVSTPTKYFGVSEGKNVLTVLCESLEWYTFLRGDSEYSGNLQGEYANALDIPQDVLKLLYPNLTEYYNESVVMTNFHSREKTDISETISIMGSYPTGAYVNYEFAGNTLPYTLPNILKLEMNGDIYLRSFHNGFKTFYNRHEAHPMLGFEGLTDMYDMEEMSNKLEAAGGEEIFYNYMDEGERNLDSEMVETAKDLMFPTDGRFYSYITTITMHGMYYDRANLRGENNLNIAERLSILEQYKPTDELMENFESAESLYYYMTTGLELDHMLGCIKRELKDRGLWDNTVIVLFGDHNAYYQEMSNYVKDIPDYNAENKFTDLYNVP